MEKSYSVCSILELTASDGKVYKTKVYNLDAILSVGYRVNSKNHQISQNEMCNFAFRKQACSHYRDFCYT